MKYIYLSIIALFLFSCQQDEFETGLQYLGTDAIKYVRLYPNSSVLTADGKSQLSFKVKAFTEIERTETDDEGRETHYIDTIEMIYDRLPQNEISIRTIDGQEVNDFVYTTDEVSGGKQQFVAKIGPVSSNPVTVELRAAPAPFDRVSIPIVFHVLSNTDTKEICAGVTREFIEKKVERLNKVFSGAFASPTAMDTGIRFVLAETDPAGKPLEEPGIRREDRKDEKTADIKRYITNNLMWDPSKYLNVWIYAASVWDWPSDEPAYVLDNGTTIKGLNLRKVATAESVKPSKPGDVGITLATGSVFSSNWENIFGVFFGLLSTEYSARYWDEDDMDYCSDTYTYVGKYFAAEKWTFAESEWEQVYYDSYNIMDENSAVTTITYEQALRIRKVIENCPLRMMGQ